MTQLSSRADSAGMTDDNRERRNVQGMSRERSKIHIVAHSVIKPCGMAIAAHVNHRSAMNHSDHETISATNDYYTGATPLMSAWQRGDIAAHNKLQPRFLRFRIRAERDKNLLKGPTTLGSLDPLKPHWGRLGTDPPEPG
ncbi:hypothetical protein J6590_071202 [Homalodisca vitripennis]|nr:hypothetical protein J6590_071202 [Homalodisca vitripennis]